MKRITSYFDSCRSACKNNSEDKLDDIFKQHNVASLAGAKEVPTKIVRCIIADMCSGSSYTFSQAQEEDIAKSLYHNFLNGKPDLTAWKKSFKYWTRQDTSEKLALLVIDVQLDFISGSLALRNCPAKQEGEDVVAVINKLKKDHKFHMVVFTLDWHPQDHCSFITNASKYPIHSSCNVKVEEAKVYDTVIYDCDNCPQSQILWPVHCEQDSEGAKLHPGVQINPTDNYIYKGKHSHIDSYSAFWDNGKLSKTELSSMLLDNNITTCLVCGLATDFCVSCSAIDSAEHGFDTYMIDDASRGVSFDSMEAAKKKMTCAGVKIINTDQVAPLFA